MANTALTVLNNCRVRAREETLSTLAALSDTLGLVQLRMLNDVLSELATRDMWPSLRTSVATALTGSGSPYTLAGINAGAQLLADPLNRPHVYDATGARLTVYTDEPYFDTFVAGSTTQPVVLFKHTGSAMQMKVAGDSAGVTITSHWQNTPNEVVAASDATGDNFAIPFPQRIVEAFLYARMIEERGEDLGTAPQAALVRAEAALFQYLAASGTYEQHANRVIAVPWASP